MGTHSVLAFRTTVLSKNGRANLENHRQGKNNNKE
jgi:hypothetical protein